MAGHEATDKPFANMVDVNKVLKFIDSVIKNHFKFQLDVEVDLTPEHERIVISSEVPNRAKEFYDFNAYRFEEVVSFKDYYYMNNECYWDTADDLYEVSLCIEQTNYIFYKKDNGDLYICGQAKNYYRDRFSLQETKKAVLRLLSSLYNISMKELSKDVNFSLYNYVEEDGSTLMRALIVCSDRDNFLQISGDLCSMDPGHWIKSQLGDMIIQSVMEKPVMKGEYPCVQVFVWCRKE